MDKVVVLKGPNKRSLDELADQVARRVDEIMSEGNPDIEATRAMLMAELLEQLPIPVAAEVVQYFYAAAFRYGVLRGSKDMVEAIIAKLTAGRTL